MNLVSGGRSMGYQVPKATHPWRRYQQPKEYSEDTVIEIEIKKISLKEYIKELSDNWDSMKINIPLDEWGTYYTKDVSDAIMARWIINVLKRNYA